LFRFGWVVQVTSYGLRVTIYMRIIKQKDVKIFDLVKALKQGKVIVYPTETCYGLGCDATNQEAVDDLFKIKQRQHNKSVLVLVSGIDMITRYVDWTPKLEELSQKYWPGPLTVVTKIKDGIELPVGVVGQDNTIAFRITGHHFAYDLCVELDGPIVSTSANITAQKSPYDIKNILEMFKNTKHKPSIIIDSGPLPHKNPSTIVRVIGNNVELIRQGEIVVD